MSVALLNAGISCDVEVPGSSLRATRIYARQESCLIQGLDLAPFTENSAPFSDENHISTAGIRRNPGCRGTACDPHFVLKGGNEKVHPHDPDACPEGRIMTVEDPVIGRLKGTIERRQRVDAIKE